MTAYHIAKRAIDISFAASALVVLSPLIALIALAIRIDMGSPVLFRQIRPGLHGRPFTLVKFRTMRNATERDGRPIPSEERITRLGRLLRRTSLDEIPEAWNILKGEMSIVGPRPLLVEYLDLYTEDQARRHEVPPGLTGWAAVQGRRVIPFQERLAQDVWYVDHRSLRLDAEIMLRTIRQVLSGEGAEPARFLDISELGFERYRAPAPPDQPRTTDEDQMP